MGVQANQQKSQSKQKWMKENKPELKDIIEEIF